MNHLVFKEIKMKLFSFQKFFYIKQLHYQKNKDKIPKSLHTGSLIKQIIGQFSFKNKYNH